MKNFQVDVQSWMAQCFTPEICADVTERNHRFLEEALELVQSKGCTRSEAHQLVDYVYDRPAGEPFQEVGGAMVTLAALCLAAKLNMWEAAETELARVWTKIEAIRAKQAAKPKHSPLPQHVERSAARELAERCLPQTFQDELNDLRAGYRAIMEGLKAGRISGDDVVWFDGITTLFDFCDLTLNGEKQRQTYDLLTLEQRFAFVVQGLKRIASDEFSIELDQGDNEIGDQSRANLVGVRGIAQKLIEDHDSGAPGQPRWRHLKRGTVYTEIGRGKLQTSVLLGDDDPIVIYRGEDGNWWARHVAEFEDGRFVRVSSESAGGDLGPA